MYFDQNVSYNQSQQKTHAAQEGFLYFCVSKLSGCYYLTDDFCWDKFPLNKIIINYVPRAWSGQPVYNTRYYRFPKEYVNRFLSGLERYMTAYRSVPDIEHGFYRFSVIDLDIVHSPNKIGVAGRLTGNNTLVSD